MLGSPILYLKGMRILMFQLSGFFYSPLDVRTFAKDLLMPFEDPTAVPETLLYLDPQ